MALIQSFSAGTRRSQKERSGRNFPTILVLYYWNFCSSLQLLRDISWLTSCSLSSSLKKCS